ncbi:MAG: MBL fold metallo-hydrolase, partial [Gemmatimonadaceae bacterium]
GAGDKMDARQRDIYGLDRRRALDHALADIGLGADAIDYALATHLHFDHAGGNTWVDDAGNIKPTFPKARYFVKRGEYDYATHTNERTSASYFERNFMPVVSVGKFEFVVREREIVKGIRVVPTPGHTPFHQSILIDSAGERGFFLGDLCPTSAHLPLPWIMGYDVEPLVTLETKRRILRQAEDEDWLLIFEHDATVPWGKVHHDGRSYHLRELAADSA